MSYICVKIIQFVQYFEIKLHQTENQKKFAEKKVKFCFLA